MAKILINGLNLSIGGGKNILDNYIVKLFENELKNTYYVLTPNYQLYKNYSKEKLIVVDIKKIYKNNIFFIGLYFFKFPRLLNELKIDLIFNFGDVIIPTKTPQIFFFDWAYAVYAEPYIWLRMKAKDRLIRKTKVFLIDHYINKVKLTICQTSNIAQRLRQKYDISDLKIIPTPLGMSLPLQSDNNFNLPVGKKYFLYPAGYATHKNFQIIFKLGRLIEEKGLPFLIVLTIDEEIAVDFLEKVKENNLCSIFNVGKLKSDEIALLYKLCDAMLFPSLLESYGLPYIEAMAFGKPILTSDLDFAHAICADVAFYFDPFDPDSILNVMKRYDDDKIQLEEKIRRGKVIVETLPDWKEVFLQFEEQIEIILIKDSHAR